MNISSYSTQNHYFVGVDGGGSKTRIRIEDAQGLCLGMEQGGPAHLALSVSSAWEQISSCLKRLLLRLNLPPDSHFHVGMGLAGVEIDHAYHAFVAQPHFFRTLVVVSDAYAACRGAHGGREGAIIIAGTGSVGCQWQGGSWTQVGGNGFPHDAQASGAGLGFAAIQLALKYADGRIRESSLARVLLTHFGNQLKTMSDFAQHADATAYASLAPLIIAQAQLGDPDACYLLQHAAQGVNEIHQALLAQQLAGTAPLACVLQGGISEFLRPYLHASLLARLSIGLASAEAGAILIVREQLATKGNTR